MINIQALKKFHDEKYARNLVLKTDNVEIIVVCWRPGQASPLHGHGPTDGVILVVEGELQNTNVYPDGRRVTNVWRKGDVGHTPVGVKHQIMNSSDQDVVTFHIYAPPLGPEYLNPDLGYANDVKIKEIQMPDEMIRFVMAAMPSNGLNLPSDNYVI